MTEHDCIHDIFVNSARHLMDKLDGGSEHFVLKLVSDADAVEFDMDKPADLRAISRLHIRHLLMAVTCARQERDEAIKLAAERLSMGNTSSHPFVPHYETTDKTVQERQHMVIRSLFTMRSNVQDVAAALVILGWDLKEARLAVQNATKDM